MLLSLIRRKLIDGAQKAVAAGIAAGAAFLAAKVPELAPVLNGETVATLGQVLGTVAGVLISSGAGYAVTYWKANR